MTYADALDVHAYRKQFNEEARWAMDWSLAAVLIVLIVMFGSVLIVLILAIRSRPESGDAMTKPLKAIAEPLRVLAEPVSVLARSIGVTNSAEGRRLVSRVVSS